MGVLNHIVVAHPSEAEAVRASSDPSQYWNGFLCRGLNRITLVALWSIIETGSVDDGFEPRFDQITTIPEDDDGPWVDLLPAQMLSALASIAAMDEQEHESIAELWSESGEMDGWNPADILAAVKSIGDSAETAQLENKTLLIWTSL